MSIPSGDKLVELAKRFYEETKKNQLSSSVTSMKFDFNGGQKLINELFAVLLSIQNEKSGAGNFPKTAESIKASLLSYKAHLSQKSALTTDINALKIDLKAKANAITDWERKLSSLKNDIPAPTLKQKEPTKEQNELFNAQLVIWNNEIKEKQDNLNAKINLLSSLKNKLFEQIEAKEQLLAQLINSTNEADAILDQQVKVLEQFFTSIYRDAISKDKELSALLEKASTAFQVSIGLSAASLTAAFVPAVFSIAAAIIVGAIPCAIVLAIAFFVLLGSLSSKTPILSQGGGDPSFLEHLLNWSIYLGVQTYPIAYAAMPFVAIISAVAAVVSLAVSGVFAINAALVNASKDQYFEETLRKGLNKIPLPGNNQSQEASVTSVSIFRESPTTEKDSKRGAEPGDTAILPIGS